MEDLSSTHVCQGLNGNTWQQITSHDESASLECRKLTNSPIGGWFRGSRTDFDEWAEIADDSRWSYDGLLPFFRRSETFWSNTTNPDQHGHDGPLQIEVPSTTGRAYPLRDAVYSSYESVGIRALPGLDANAGDNLGFGQIAENRRHGARQIAPKYFPLDGVSVLLNTLVEKVLVQRKVAEHSSSVEARAVGVVLSNGTRIYGERIIASAGTYRTPQLLMLSGIGPARTLAKHNITQNVDHPEVGQNLADHGFFGTEWTLTPEYRNSTVDSGNPLFSLPQYGLGQPNNFAASFTVEDTPGLVEAITRDEGRVPAADHWLLRNRTFMEAFIFYGNVAGLQPQNVSYVTTANVEFLPTSRGHVSIASSDPLTSPVIDANFSASEVDRFVWREGIRRMIRLMAGGQTALSRGIVAAEATPSGLPALAVGVTDEEIDARVRAAAS